MYCNKCGAVIEENGARFCQSCGSAVEELQNGNTYDNNQQNNYSQDYQNNFQQDYQNNAQQDYGNGGYMPEGMNPNETGLQQNDESKKKKTVIIAVCAVAAVAVICAIILGVFFLSSGKKGGNDEQYQDLTVGVRAQVVEDVPDVDYIEMRDHPTDDSEISIQIQEKEYVDILNNYSSDNNGYIYVRHLSDGNYNNGWVPATYLKKVGMSDEYKSLKEGAKCRVIADSAETSTLSLYKDKGLDSEVLTTIPDSQYVDVIEDYSEYNGDFVYVEYVKDSKSYKGWVLGQYIYFVDWNKNFEADGDEAEQVYLPEVNPSRPDLKKGAVCIINNTTPYHGGVTMRSLPSYNSSEVTSISEGKYIIVTSAYSSTDNGYVLTTYDNGSKIYRGWISAKFLSYITTWSGYVDSYLSAVGKQPSEEKSTTFYKGGDGSTSYMYFERGDVCYVGYETVGHDGLNFRTGPSSNSSLIRVIEEGTYATVEKDYSSSDDGYVKVNISGQVGYLFGKYLVYESHNYDYDTPTYTTTTTAPTTTTTQPFEPDYYEEEEEEEEQEEQEEQEYNPDDFVDEEEEPVEDPETESEEELEDIENDLESFEEEPEVEIEAEEEPAEEPEEEIEEEVVEEPEEEAEEEIVVEVEE